MNEKVHKDLSVHNIRNNKKMKRKSELASSNHISIKIHSLYHMIVYILEDAVNIFILRSK